jgi:hypothetical protein
LRNGAVFDGLFTSAGNIGGGILVTAAGLIEAAFVAGCPVFSAAFGSAETGAVAGMAVDADASALGEICAGANKDRDICSQAYQPTNPTNTMPHAMTGASHGFARVSVVRECFALKTVLASSALADDFADVLALFEIFVDEAD